MAIVLFTAGANRTNVVGVNTESKKIVLQSAVHTLSQLFNFVQMADAVYHAPVCLVGNTVDTLVNALKEYGAEALSLNSNAVRI
ncbi:hypothetical protein [Vibrio crassostreae]|uniref:hypothetical protein n=1 Tax=Vibrio crassostreae TaxID=246167 RepID=UPI001B30F518|nr:hypothetical protein [Vibrio crassostreae]